MRKSSHIANKRYEPWLSSQMERKNIWVPPPPTGSQKLPVRSVKYVTGQPIGQQVAVGGQVNPFVNTLT